MRRILTGGITALTIWIGSALAAEAQQITPTGPLALTGGAPNADFSANVHLPSPSGYRIRIWFTQGPTESTAGTTEMVFKEYLVGNPGVVDSVYTKNVPLTIPPISGWWVQVSAAIKTSTMTDFTPRAYMPAFQVTSSGPYSKATTLDQSTVQPTLSVEAIDRDRRHEA